MTSYRPQPGKRIYLRSLLVVLLIVATDLYAAPANTFTDKPADPGFVFTHSVFDCPSRQTITVTPGLVSTIADTTSGTSAVDSYSCTQWSETGPEAFYELNVTEEVNLFAGLRNLGDLDLDLFLLSTCDNDSCLIGANVEFSIRLQPGTYTLVVDGYAKPEPQAGPYTLEISAHKPGLPLEICAEGATTPVTCQLETATFDGNLFPLADLVQTNDCTLNIAQAGEQWYAVTVSAYHEFTATVSNVATTMDPVLWLFPNCGPDAQCLDFIDEKTSGQGEALTWANSSYRDSTVYLGVDAILAPATTLTGAFTLEIHCQGMVATEKKSLGSVRALFR